MLERENSIQGYFKQKKPRRTFLNEKRGSGRRPRFSIYGLEPNSLELRDTHLLVLNASQLLGSYRLITRGHTPRV